MGKPIVNLNEVELVPRPADNAPKGRAAESFAVSTAQLARQLGAKKLGYNISSVPPGKAGYPFHSHFENEEMFLILKGSGEVRIGADTFPVREGDIIACPPGGPETAHQIRNTGADELRYLAVNTRIGPEICEYPDSGKFGVYAEKPAAKDGEPGHFYFMGRPEMLLDYWDGEGGNSR